MRRSKKILLVLLVGLLSMFLVGILAGCGGGSNTTTTASATSDTTASALSSTNTTDKEPYVLGVVMSLTGPVSFIGIDEADGLQVMADWINEEGGVNGHPFELIVEDSGNDASKANAAFTKLIYSDKVDALIGPSSAVLVPTAQAMAERGKIPLIAPSPPEMSTRDQLLKWSFTVVPGPEPLADGMVAVAKKNSYKAVVGISDNSTGFKVALTQFGEQAPLAGIEYTRLTDTFNRGDADMSSQALKVKAAAEEINADAILAASSGLDAATLIRALNKIGVTLPVIGTYAFGNPAVIELVGETKTYMEWPDMKAIIYPQLPDGDPQKALLTEMGTRFKKKYERDLTSFAANAHPVMMAYKMAFEKGGKDKAAVRDAMENIEEFVTTNGVINYGPGKRGHENRGIDGMALVTVQDGTFKLTGTFSDDGTFKPVQ